ncbi:MAG: hypothetical protein FJ109_03185 [Deltaproteobacteria bacterium]|nr:hypothetical protein [Deltaproteobacteria bacterium]
MPGAREKFDRLYATATLQDGFFTARQATAAGYGTNSHAYHVKTGNWTREYRGIFRLARYPATERPDLMLWFLWSMDRNGRPQGVYSHSTALSLYELSDVNPAKIHMTVPVEFRRRAPVPEVLSLRSGHIPLSDRRPLLGVAVTSPLRTVVDVVQEGSLSPDLLEQAVQEALARGLVTGRELAGVRLGCPELDEFLRRIQL